MLKKVKAKEENYQKEKNFGIVFGTVSLLIATYFAYNLNFQISLICLVVAILFLLGSFYTPSVFKIPNVLWLGFGLKLSKLTTPLILFILYIFLFSFLGLFAKLFGRDVFKFGLFGKSDVKTFWHNRSRKLRNMKELA